jgi:hypothetical protein
VAEKKVIFIAFAKEDERSRDLLRGQSLNTDTPFEYVDMSVKDLYSSDGRSASARAPDGAMASSPC